MRQWFAAETGHEARTSAGRSDAGETAEALSQAARRIAELEQDVAARDQFIAVIGHEMRNPMVPILLSVDRARRMMAAGDQERLRQSLATLDLAVGELRTLDAGRRTDALDRGHPAQGLEPLRRDRPKRAPSPLELIDPGNEAENFRGDRERIFNEALRAHTQIYTYLHLFTPI